MSIYNNGYLILIILETMYLNYTLYQLTETCCSMSNFIRDVFLFSIDTKLFLAIYENFCLQSINRYLFVFFFHTRISSLKMNEFTPYVS